MTVFKQEEEKPIDRSAWFQFRTSRKDKAVSDQIEVLQKGATIESREFTAEEQKQFVESVGKLFIFDDPQEGAAEFQIRRAVYFFLERNEQRTKKHQFVLNPTTRAMEHVSYYPELTVAEKKKEADDMYDYAIVGIRGATWEGGKEIECNRENKLKLMKDEQFSRFVQHCMNTLLEAEKAEAEQTAKN